MSLKAGSQASRPWPSSRLLLLGLLLLPAVVAQLSADPEEGDGFLQCMCVKTVSGVHPKHIASLEVIRAGRHCPTSQMIATLKNGQKICLDPHAPLYKKIMKKLMKSKPPTD
ncbi:platelet factor 4-like isoform X1 [Myotis daubentonii]|uniref:platelet factor 4-like isoform X1 n=1 Tax=Myotis daubentonii TaxID=98922 RepID=UPI002873EDDE|nr:platelet factor 4-like isoform X1 [Myotis daubentonii]